jgi:hypothetical protein
MSNNGVPGDKPGIYITGRLDSKDIKRFTDAADGAAKLYKVPYSDIVVWLDSLGGDMQTIIIGAVIHDLGMQTYVALSVLPETPVSHVERLVERVRRAPASS